MFEIIVDQKYLIITYMFTLFQYLEIRWKKLQKIKQTQHHANNLKHHEK